VSAARWPLIFSSTRFFWEEYHRNWVDEDTPAPFTDDDIENRILQVAADRNVAPHGEADIDKFERYLSRIKSSIKVEPGCDWNVVVGCDWNVVIFGENGEADKDHPADMLMFVETLWTSPEDVV